MICGNYYKAVLITLLVLFGGFLGAKTAYGALSLGSDCHLQITSAPFSDTSQIASSTSNHIYYLAMTINPTDVGHGSFPPSVGVLPFNDLTTYPATRTTLDFGVNYGTNHFYLIASDIYYKEFSSVMYEWYEEPLSHTCSSFAPVTSIPTQITSFTYSTTTQFARVKGFWNATTTPNVFESLYFYQDSTLFGKQDEAGFTATTTGNFDFSFFFHGLPVATSTQNKVFGLYATINQTDNRNVITTGMCATAPFSATWEQCGQINTLLVATSTIVNSFNYNLPPSQPLQQTYTFDECTLKHFDLGLCLADVAVGLFQPLDGDIHWESIKNLIETKAPFGYFTMAKDSLGNLSATSTPTAVITIPSHIKNVILIPLDTAIAGILWFFFLFNFYKRLKFITI